MYDNVLTIDKYNILNNQRTFITKKYERIRIL